MCISCTCVSPRPNKRVCIAPAHVGVCCFSRSWIDNLRAGSGDAQGNAILWSPTSSCPAPSPAAHRPARPLKNLFDWGRGHETKQTCDEMEGCKVAVNQRRFAGKCWVTHTLISWHNNTALFANPPELPNKPELILASDSLPLFCAQ